MSTSLRINALFYRDFNFIKIIQYNFHIFSLEGIPYQATQLYNFIGRSFTLRLWSFASSLETDLRPRLVENDLIRRGWLGSLGGGFDRLFPINFYFQLDMLS